MIREMSERMTYVKSMKTHGCAFKLPDVVRIQCYKSYERR